jgi:predicted permease
MSLLSGSFGRRLTNLFRRTQVDRAIDLEVQSHIQMRIDDNLAAGMSDADARRDALVRFGNPTATREQVASADMALQLDGLWFDLRFAARQLRRSPWFAITATLTLACAIGANAVVFSILNALVLRPLDVPQAESLYATFHDGDAGQSYPNYLDLRDRNRSFSSLAAFTVAEAGLDTGHGPSRVWVYEASGNYWDTLGQKPFLGHFFAPSDEHGFNSAPYTVLNYAFWQTQFQSDRSVVGKVVLINQHPFTVVGVAQPEFHGTLLFFNPDLFVPLVDHEHVQGVNDLASRGKPAIFMTIGHLKPGVTPAKAAADLNAVWTDLQKTYPKDNGKLTFTLGRPNLYGDYLGRPVRVFLSGLMLLSGLILLAACANLGGLFAARASDRSREVALRLALGSSRRRILRGLFSEAALIALAGGIAGLTAGIAVLRALSVWEPFPRWPIHLAVTPDARVYTVAVLLTLLSGFLFGAVPVRQVLTTNPYEVVKAGLTGTRARRQWFHAREVLLVLQIAICAVLVTSSMVAVRGLARSLHDDFGFAVDNSMLVDTDLTMAGYTGDRVPQMQTRMIDALKAIPGVTSVGLAHQVPLGDGSTDSNVFNDNTADLLPAHAAADSFLYRISPGYFDASATPFLMGRTFTLHDGKDAPRVAVVNREFAHKLFGSPEKAMGRYYKMPDGARIQIVGIVATGKYASLTEDPQPAMFLPILQSPSSQTYFLVRSSRDPESLATAIRSTLHDVDAELPVNIQTRYKALDAMFFGPRMASLSLGVLGAIGAVLSITGIFGMAAYSVSKRRRELGIRVALGAQKTEVLQAALGRPVKLLAIGSGTGLLFGVLASQLLALTMSNTTARDPLVLVAVIASMALLGVIATWIPAQRALSVDPVILLREE